MARKINKFSMRRIIVLGTVSIVAILSTFYTVFSYIFKIINLEHQQKSLTMQLNLLKENEEDLKIEIQKLKDPEYIARYARENYLYSKDGEYVIKIENNKVENETNTDNKTLDYKFYIIGVLGIGTFIYFVRKKKKA